MSKKSQVTDSEELSDDARRLLADLKANTHSTNEGNKLIVQNEIEALLKECGKEAVYKGKCILFDYHYKAHAESKLDYSDTDEETFMKENDDYYDHRAQVIFIADDIARITGIIPEVADDDPLKEELQFILSNESINATGTLNRCLCGTGGQTVEYFEVCNYLNIQLDGGGSITLFEDDLKQLLNVAQTANRQTSGKFKLKIDAEHF